VVRAADTLGCGSFGVRDALTIDEATLRLSSSPRWRHAGLGAAALIHSPRPVLASLGAILRHPGDGAGVVLTQHPAHGGGHDRLAGACCSTRARPAWWTSASRSSRLIVGEPASARTVLAQARSVRCSPCRWRTYGYERMVDTAIGAGIGVLVTRLIAPPTYSRGSQALRRVGEDLSVCWPTSPPGSRAGPSASTVHAGWRAPGDLSRRAHRRGNRESGAREPTVHHRAAAEMDRLRRIGEARVALEHAVPQTRGMMRSVLDLHPALRSAGVARCSPRSATCCTTPASRSRRSVGCSNTLTRATATSRASPSGGAAARDRAASALRACPRRPDGTARLARLDRGRRERLIREVDVRDGAHVRQ